MIGQFKCGCVVSAQFNEDPPADFFHRPCPSCYQRGLDPNWADIGAELKRRRQEAYSAQLKKHKDARIFLPLGQCYSIAEIALSLGLNASDVSAMEHGRKDPAPLVAYWEGQDV